MLNMPYTQKQFDIIGNKADIMTTNLGTNAAASMMLSGMSLGSRYGAGVVPTAMSNSLPAPTAVTNQAIRAIGNSVNAAANTAYGMATTFATSVSKALPLDMVPNLQRTANSNNGHVGSGFKTAMPAPVFGV